ncbi:YlqD family protein [Bacillus badius]|uniref:YlqD family protein n=1 Tax=Bacillus badius TaxID=1455 RepID=UPI001CC09EE1|nr:YlqD family protein [Bacillus badius]UAT31794.1 YlqD family protein [Bacillus badius]
MQVLRTTVVKQVLTETLKQSLLSSYQDKKSQLEKEYEQLRFELKKTERQQKGSRQQKAGFFQKEMEQRRQKIENIDFQKSQLEMLPLGSELKEKEVQALIDVQVGDRWEETEKTIVIKDGIVVEIR